MSQVSTTDVKTALHITGTYMDDAIQLYIDEVEAYLVAAGVKTNNISKGIVVQGVTDLMNLEAGGGQFSRYFHERAAQLALL